MIIERVEADSVQGSIEEGQEARVTSCNKRNSCWTWGKKSVRRTITWCADKLIILGDFKSSFGQVHDYLDKSWNLFLL